MEANIIDELFERINSLEIENAMLVERSKILQDELDKKELMIEDSIDITDLQRLVSGEKIEMNSDLVNVDIVYVPFDNFNEMYIAGDFNGWEKSLMQMVRIFNIRRIESLEYLLSW
jgi:hypothetical protein